MPEPCVFHEEIDALSSSSASPVASDAVSGQEGSDVESGQLSQQNRESTEVGAGTTVHGIARDVKDCRVPGQEADLPVLFPNRL